MSAHKHIVYKTLDFDKQCESYKKSAELSNSVEGITATVSCNADERIISDEFIYEMNDITDKSKVYTFNYISNGKFDLEKWKQDRISGKSVCTEK